MSKVEMVVKYWLPVVVWAVVIFTFSSFPTVKTADFYLGDFLIKKTAHLVEYGILATLFYRALINSNINFKKFTSKKIMYLAVLLAMLYGATDEFHQLFTPGRGPSVRDVIIDATGASIFIFGILQNIKKMPGAVRKLYSRLDITNN